MPSAARSDPRSASRDGLRGVLIVIVAAGLAAGAAALGWAVKYAQTRAETEAVAVALTAGEPSRAPDLLTRFGCAGCHTIPGAPGADGVVGPPLSQLRARVFIGGTLRNTADNLIGFIVDPQGFAPRSAMPRTGITQAQARDVAAFLYAQ